MEKKCITSKAAKIFALTTLSDSDIDTARVAQMMAHELKEAGATLEECVADGWFAAELAQQVKHIAEAAKHYSTLVELRPVPLLNDGGRPTPVNHLIPELCEDIIAIFEAMPMKDEWRQGYSVVLARLRYYAGLLKDDPDAEAKPLFH